MGQGLANEPSKLTETERAIDERENSGNSSTNQTESKRRRGRPPGSTASQETKLPKLVNVEIPGEEKTEDSKPPKKSSAGRPKKASAKKVDSTQIEMMLLTVSAVVSSRPGMEVWNLSIEETKQLAEPLANILAKNETLANVTGEHADAFALVAACFMIFIPKFITYQATKPKKPKTGEQVNYGSKPSELQKRTPSTSDRTNDGRNAPASQNNGQNFGGQLSSLIPTIA